MLRIAMLFIVLAAPAHAACREDLVAVSQAVERTRAALKGAAADARCAAYRQHITALTKVRDVFARCDLGGDKTKNAAQVRTTIADLRRQMRNSCAKK